MRDNTGRAKLMADAKEGRRRHSRGIDIKKSWVLGMFSKKQVMKWQKGSKQHSHMRYTCRHSGTKLYYRQGTNFPREIYVEENRNQAEKYKTDTQTIRNCKPNYKLRKNTELLQNV